MKNRPAYHKLYADMIRDKYPEKESQCAQYLKKENWKTLDVIRVDQILFGANQKRSDIASDKKHRSYDTESIKQILRYQMKNKLNNKQLADKYGLSRNTVAKWRSLFQSQIR